MHVFYAPDIAINPELPEEEAGHCLRVLRLSIGDEVTLTDGIGNFYKAVISATGGKRCQVKVTETIPQEKGGMVICMWPWHQLKIWIAPNGLWKSNRNRIRRTDLP